MFKFKHNLAPAILNDIFLTTSHEYNLRGKNMFKSKYVSTVFNRKVSTVFNRKVSTVFNGTETVTYRAQRYIKKKNSKSLNEFKNKIKGWKPINCQCR